MAAYAALSEQARAESQKAAAESQTAQNWQRGGLTGEDLPHGSKIVYLTGVIKSAAGAARDSQSSGFEYSAPADAFSDNQWLRKDPYEITSKEELWGQYIFAVATATAGKGVPYLKGLHTDFKAGKINKAEFAQKVKQAQIDNNFYRDNSNQYDLFKTPDGNNWNWPKNLGFKNDSVSTTLPIGTRLDRYGNPTGSFLSPEGVRFEKRALAPGSGAEKYYKYEVIKPLPVKQGEIAPAFGQPGGGIQILPNFDQRVNVQWLLDNQYLREIK